MVIDGKAIAKALITDLQKQKAPHGELVVVFPGSDLASQKFLNEKAKVAAELGIPFRVRHPLHDEELLKTIEELNGDANVRGIILQMPFPDGFNTKKAISALALVKDVDALKGEQRLTPPAVLVVETILQYLHFPLSQKKAVVLGRGALVGVPVAEWLTSRAAQVSQFHTEHFDWAELRGADLIVSGMGAPGFITGEHIKEGALLIDFGYGLIDGRVSGDFDFASCEKKAIITPTPGGTGPILVAELFKNFYAL